MHAAHLIRLPCGRSMLTCAILSFPISQRFLQLDADETSLMRQGFVSENQEGEAEIPFTTGLWSISQGSLGVTSSFCAAITQNVILLHHAPMDPRQHASNSGISTQHHRSEPNIINHSTVLHRSTAGFSSILNLLCHTFHHSLHFLSLLFSCSPIISFCKGSLLILCIIVLIMCSVLKKKPKLNYFLYKIML